MHEGKDMAEMPDDMEHKLDHQISCYGPDTLDEIIPIAPTADAEASKPAKA